MQLLSAVATQAAQDVASGARRVDTHQHGVVLLPVALDERHVLQSVTLLAEGDEFEVAVLRRQVDRVANLDERLFSEPVADHVLDGDDFHVPLLSQSAEFWQTRHRSVLVHDFHQRTGRV